MDYPHETFSAAERARLAPHFSDLDGPVFALRNLPETVKGALFARYSRYPGTLRRLFLDEFADSLGELPQSQGARQGASGPQGRGTPHGQGASQGGGATQDGSAVDEGERAAQLYERIFLGYGDDSVAQLGGAHVACEWASNVLTKILQRPRLGAYLEQSTRYIAYDAPLPGGGYRYFDDRARLGPEYGAALDQIFAIYAAAIPRVSASVAERFPRGEGESEAAHARAIKAKTLDLLRGLLPAASLSHMGIFASGQTYEQLILHLLAHPLPEAQRYGRMLLRAVQAAIPSFVTRVERPDRGGVWIDYLRTRSEAGRSWARRLGLDEHEGAGGPSVTLLRAEGDEDDLLAALLFEAAGAGEPQTRAAVAELAPAARAELLRDLLGGRENRRHRPGRGLETLRYRFEIVSDYGAFRDLQRHRMLTVQWQALSPALGAEVPEEVEAAGAGEDYRRALEISRREYERLAALGLRDAAQYAVCLGYRIRYVLDLNARAAMQLIELRSGREGHPGYRAVAHQLHAQIAAVHPAVGAAMTHIDGSAEPRLERIGSELRGEARRRAAANPR